MSKRTLLDDMRSLAANCRDVDEMRLSKAAYQYFKARGESVKRVDIVYNAVEIIKRAARLAIDEKDQWGQSL